MFICRKANKEYVKARSGLFSQSTGDRAGDFAVTGESTSGGCLGSCASE